MVLVVFSLNLFVNRLTMRQTH